MRNSDEFLGSHWYYENRTSFRFIITFLHEMAYKMGV